MGETSGSKIWLYAGSLNERIDLLEKSFTQIKDQMDILDTETKEFVKVWDSPACRQWNGEFKNKQRQVKDCVERMEKLVVAVNEVAKMLAETEKRNSFLVELAAGGG